MTGGDTCIEKTNLKNDLYIGMEPMIPVLNIHHQRQNSVCLFVDEEINLSSLNNGFTGQSLIHVKSSYADVSINIEQLP